MKRWDLSLEYVNEQNGDLVLYQTETDEPQRHVTMLTGAGHAIGNLAIRLRYDFGSESHGSKLVDVIHLTDTLDTDQSNTGQGLVDVGPSMRTDALGYDADLGYAH